MSEPKASDLTAEERAIVEEMVTRTGTHWGYTGVAIPFGHGSTEEFAGWLQTEEYAEAYGTALRRIEARRALFSPAQPEPKREEKFRPCGCVVCTCEDAIQCHGCGAKLCELHRQQRETAPSPAPVVSELPEAVQGALDVLRRSYTEWVPPSDAVRKKAHDALEAWARSLTSASAGLPKVRAYLNKRRIDNGEDMVSPGFEASINKDVRMLRDAIAELDSAQAVPVPPVEAIRRRNKRHDHDCRDFQDREEIDRWLAAMDAAQREGGA